MTLKENEKSWRIDAQNRFGQWLVWQADVGQRLETSLMVLAEERQRVGDTIKLRCVESTTSERTVG